MQECNSLGWVFFWLAGIKANYGICVQVVKGIR